MYLQPTHTTPPPQTAERRNGGGLLHAIEQTTRQGGADRLRVTGYAAVFDDITALPHFLERVGRKAFAGANLSDVRFLVDHAGLPLARSSAGTLELEVDARGLKYTADLPNTERGRELFEAVRRGDISQSSFAFTIEAQTWTEQDGAPLRTIDQIGAVLDVSAVVFPAYPTTSVTAF